MGQKGSCPLPLSFTDRTMPGNLWLPSDAGTPFSILGLFKVCTGHDHRLKKRLSESGPERALKGGMIRSILMLCSTNGTTQKQPSRWRAAASMGGVVSIASSGHPGGLRCGTELLQRESAGIYQATLSTQLLWSCIVTIWMGTGPETAVGPQQWTLLFITTVCFIVEIFLQTWCIVQICRNISFVLSHDQSLDLNI